LLFTCFPLLSQSFITSTFDDSTEDWTVSGGALYYQDQTGNPGGFIEFEDDQDGKGVFMAPIKFIGDLRGYDQGSIEFNLKNTLNNGQTMLYGYGTVTISSALLTAEKNVVPLEYINEWTSFSIPFDAENWGLTAGAWDSLLSDVTMISIQMDAQWDYYDRIGLDNFTLKRKANILETELESNNTRIILYQNYPNPMIDATSIIVELKDRGNISLSLIQLNGQKIKTIFTGELSPGAHTFKLDRRDLRKGFYFVRLQGGKDVITKKLIVN
jgi:hypothetical protein